MKILIAGLGLIGGSLAKALNKKYTVDGFDRARVLDFALKNEIINNSAENTDGYDFVIVALPPEAAIEYINNTKFKDNAVVCDICGVKSAVYFALTKDRNFRYIGTHPMAGREVSGIQNSTADLFNGASIILTKENDTDESALELAKTVFLSAGFSRSIVCGSSEHDRIIAYTSQLPHIVSGAYIKSPTHKDYSGFTGGSFQDMTRIAGMDEKIWSQLFLMNGKNLIFELDFLIAGLTDFKKALERADAAALERLIKEGRQIKDTET